MVTKSGTDEYKGHKLFAIYEEDENGDIGKYPLVSFGLKKAQALLDHIDEFEAWCEEQGLEKK
jgi:hypothetical protein